MKHYKDRLATHEGQWIGRTLTHTTCDICNYEIKAPELPKIESMHLKVNHDKGVAYWDNGHGTKVEENFDLCGPCMENKVIPALRGLGLTLEYEEYDW